MNLIRLVVALGFFPVYLASPCLLFAAQVGENSPAPEGAASMLPAADEKSGSELSAGKPGKIQQVLSASGLTLNLFETVEVYRAGYKGSSTDANIRALSDLTIRWAPKALHQGAVVARYNLYSESGRSSGPSAQDFSSLTAPPFRGLREAYFEMPFGSSFRIKIGKVDANTEFAALQNAADFSNAALGVSPTLAVMPSYPEGAPSVNAFGTINRWLGGGAGVYYTHDGAIYSVAEANVHSLSRRQARVTVGLWKGTTPTNRSSRTAETSGTYYMYEQTVLPVAGGLRGLRLFTRLSAANESAGPTAGTHLAYGATWTGIRAKDDAVGFTVLNLIPASDGTRTTTERIYEAYYKLPVGRYTTFKADLQAIERPRSLPGAPGGTVAALRMIFNLSNSAER